MPYDNYLVAGIILSVLSLIAIVHTRSEQRTPYISRVGFIIGILLLVWAFILTDSTRKLSDIPEAFVRVVAKILN